MGKFNALLGAGALVIVGTGLSACGADPGVEGTDEAPGLGEEPSASESEGLSVGQSQDALGLACGCTLPVGGLYATFRVGNESFRQQITSWSGMSEAIALWKGQSNKHIPIGELDCSCTGWNCQWGFSMDPASVRFASSAVEVCDGLPSYVDPHCETFGMGSYCPWSAQLVDLRDCRRSPSCPRVPR